MRPSGCPPMPASCGLPAAAYRLDFSAFREFAYMPFINYADVRLGCMPAAVRAVEAAFADIALAWQEALSSRSAPAVAWELLLKAIARDSEGPQAGVIPCAQEESPGRDLVVLHCRLGLPIGTVTLLLGTDLPTVQTRLAAARRTSPHPLPCTADPTCLT